MARFQALTSTGLEQTLEELRERFGLRPNQKADLLRELAEITSWVVHQAEAGRHIEARRGSEVVPLLNPAVERLRRMQEQGIASRIELGEAEVAKLAEILEQGYSPTPALRRTLARLAEAERAAPRLHWTPEE